MDVQCERCQTEYEFDDALVAGRGTTVRCTNCGHQFKVHRREVSGAGDDQWVVRTRAGRQLTFLTLRELQRAILAKEVDRGDALVRRGSPPRSLGAIAELEPFFDGRASSVPPPPPPGHGGVSPRIPGPAGVPRPRAQSVPPPRPARTTDSYTARDEPPAPRGKIDTLRPPPTAAAAPPPPIEPRPVLNAVPRAPDGQAAVSSFDDAVSLPEPAPLEASSPLPAPTVPVRRVSVASYDEFAGTRASIPSSADVYSGPRRRRVGGWAVALVLVLAVGVAGWAVAKPYLVGHTAAATPQLDPRAQAFVAGGERSLSEGNLDLSQEDFDKASALAERDPRVLLDEARVAAAKADVPWLKLRLLPAEAGDEERMTRSQLDEKIARARTAADQALAAAPEDPAALRAKIDALRLAGERDAARGYVARVIAQASQPETAYALAALDLAEPEPLWTTVTDRLRLAAAGEGNAGRARAALVFALAKSGDTAGARAELARLDALSRPYPLLPNLHAFLERAAKGAVDAGAAASVPHVDLSALPSSPPAAGAGVGGGGAGAADVPAPGEPSNPMQAASQAIKKGDWGHARQIYEGLVARNPGDSEALSGLGDCARAQGDTGGAIGAYKRALGVNPSYLPALLGLADTQWAGGDRGGAQRSYKDIADRFPEGTYPSYVKTRAEGSAPAAAPATATGTAQTPSTGTPPKSTAATDGF